MERNTLLRWGALATFLVGVVWGAAVLVTRLDARLDALERAMDIVTGYILEQLPKRPSP